MIAPKWLMCPILDGLQYRSYNRHTQDVSSDWPCALVDAVVILALAIILPGFVLLGKNPCSQNLKGLVTFSRELEDSMKHCRVWFVVDKLFILATRLIWWNKSIMVV
jgi:hypothetical protein